MKNRKYILEIVFKVFIQKVKIPATDFFPFSCAEILDYTSVCRHLIKDLLSQRSHWALGLTAVYLCEFSLALYWVPVVNPLDGISGQLELVLLGMKANNLLRQVALTSGVANWGDIIMIYGPLLQAWARRATEFILLSMRVYGRMCMS